MNKRIEAFSLAEALITLTIISLILAAVIPVISKRQNTTDSMWRYITQGTGANSNIYYGLGSSQTAILGYSVLPIGSSGSRLVVITPPDNVEISGGGNPNTVNRSLIDFYRRTGASGTTNIGRIAFDPTNMGVGVSTLVANTSGLGNTAFGQGALATNSTGSWNTAIAQAALRDNTIGTSNVALGQAALILNQTGSENTGIGTRALQANLSGVQNTAVGTSSLFLATGGTNTAVGYNSCYNIVAGTGNVCLGYAAGPTANVSNQLFIETNGAYTGVNSLIWGDFSTGVRQVKVNGAFYTTSGGVTGSDARLKNIGSENKAGLEKVLQLKVKNYTYKNDKTHRPRVGVIAQELQKIFPNSVVKGPDKYLYVDTSEMFYAMVNAIKYLNQKIFANTNRIMNLEKENKALQLKLNQQNETIKRLDLRLKKIEVKK